LRLLAISDLHLGHRVNREALPTLGEYPDDWLIVAGDVGEGPAHLSLALEALVPRFARVIWTPGNHDLWCPVTETDRTRGVARYDELVDICRRFGVLTPEDPYVAWPEDPDTFIVPLFLLYDYTFRPPEVAIADAVAWARDRGIVCGDEQMLSPFPFPTREAWCAARCTAAEARLTALPPASRTVLVNHWPLRYDLARPPRIPRFSIWCGTARTEDWGRRFQARSVISGHLHMRTTLTRDGARYEEVSLGYPRDWRLERGLDWYLRVILPEDAPGRDRFIPPWDPFRRGRTPIAESRISPDDEI